MFEREKEVKKSIFLKNERFFKTRGKARGERRRGGGGRGGRGEVEES